MVTKLKYERLNRDLTQLEVAAEAGVAEKQVSAIERGFNISKPAFHKLCDYFDLDPEIALKEVEGVEYIG